MSIDDKLVAFVCLTAISIALLVMGHESAGAITSNVVAGILGGMVGRGMVK